MAIPAKSLANLEKRVPWKKGQSGNPKGRPKRKTITEAIYEKLQACYPGIEDCTAMELLAERVVEFALVGSAQHFKEIIDRIDGPLKKPEGSESENLHEALARLMASSNNGDQPKIIEADAKIVDGNGK